MKILVNVRMFVLLLCGLLLALYFSWMANAAVGYGYSWLYQWMDIDRHIEYFAPQNRFRQGFEKVSADGHVQAFNEIVRSVHSQGKGLADIEYLVEGKAIPLLHRAEIIHLQDVANLIDTIHYLAFFSALTFFITVFIGNRYFHQQGMRADAKGVLVIFAVLMVSLASAVFIVGPKDVFYQMHIWVFPDNHQWFFYYQDSLMSTMMKAPDLFAGIAAQIVLLALLLFAVGVSAARKFKL